MRVRVRRRPKARWLALASACASAAVAAVVLYACSSDSFVSAGGDASIDANDVESGADAGTTEGGTTCASDTKLCGNVCHALGSTDFGCSDPACTACDLGPFVAQYGCGDGGACAISQCASGRSDCDGGPNGCETDTTGDPANCGACGRECPDGDLCSQGSCVTTCPPGQTPCGGSCELLDAATACGACANDCTKKVYPHATPVCRSGSCGYACATGYADCDDMGGNGCECATSTGSCVNKACCLNLGAVCGGSTTPCCGSAKCPIGGGGPYVCCMPAGVGCRSNADCCPGTYCGNGTCTAVTAGP